MENRNEVIAYFENITLLLLGILFLVFPFVISTVTSDSFILPKQIFLGSIAILTFILLGIRMIAEKSIRIRRTSFDLPVILFTGAVLLSSFFSKNMADSLTAFVPLLFSVIIYFVLTNTARNKNNSLFLLSSLVLGAVLVAVSSILFFFKIYLLPFSLSRQQNFTFLGSLLDQAIYLAVIFPLCGYYLVKLVKEKNLKVKTILFTFASVIIIMGFLVTVFQLFTSTRPVLLPFETGFQTAFAAISQDTGRILQGFLFGSGFGTYVTDFTRFKQMSFNQNAALWTLTFYNSSSALLELLATVGILGISAFVYLIVKIIKEMKTGKQNKATLSLLISIICLIFLPLSFISQTLFFIILGLFTVLSEKFFDIEFQLVSFKKGMFTLEPATPKASEKSIILPCVIMIVILIITGSLGYISTRYILSDIAFQESIVAANSNNGSLTYQDQSKAISLFQYSDVYYRVFAQTNLALANSILAQQPKGASPSAQTQQTITTLIQQSINAGRSSIAVSPETSSNWQNLASIYRALIGFGQNADSFAIATSQQAAVLDPNNPQEYLNLGGIYYQLGDFDNAQTQFQIAINLKPDYANAYYNLAHVYINKNDYTDALTQLQTVKTLVASDKSNLTEVTKEIAQLQAKIASQPPQQQSQQQSQLQPQQQSQVPVQSNQLNVNTPQTQLPTQNPPVKIPAPQTSPAPNTASPSSK